MREQSAQFLTEDYYVFCGVLLSSALCGIYYGYCKKSPGPQNTEEYLLGSRNLKTIPVAMSLVASYISGATILGTPAEIYNFGTQYWMICIALLLSGFTVSYIYLPVFFDLKLGSSYQYLELRFNGFVRTFASIMFILSSIFYLPITIYVPALAFSQVSGLNLYMVATFLTIFCIINTLAGGMKAIVSTSAWQITILFISVILIAILGISTTGIYDIFQRSNNGGRLEFFNFNLSLYERQTFWSILIGNFIHWTLYNATNQTMVQRYLSLPTIKNARISILLYLIGLSSFISICCFIGILIYANYNECDPITKGVVHLDDQLFPYYVMNRFGHLFGISGLFIAGLIGSALSPLSVVLNSTACVLLEDIVKGAFKMTPSEKMASFFIKSCIIILGLFSFASIVAIEKLGGILRTGQCLAAIGAATTGGLFTLGMLVPWSESIGALCGVIFGTFLSGWVSFGSLYATASGLIVPHKLDVSIAECPIVINGTTITEIINAYPDESDVFPLYRISYHWITTIGCLTVLVVGSLVSLFVNGNPTKPVNRRLISPLIYRFLPKEYLETEKINRQGEIQLKVLQHKSQTTKF